MPTRLSCARAAAALTALAAVLAVAPQHAANAQSFGDRLKKRAEEAAKRAAENRAGQKAAEATNAAMDKAENVVKCAASDTKCINDAKKAGKKVDTTPSAQSAAAGGGGGGAGAGAATPADYAASGKVGEGAWANYDFKPGERVLYADEFTGDEVGDFPRRMEFKSGAHEIVEWQNARWLRSTQTGKFYVVLPEVLPDRFTMEFDYSIPAGEVWITLDDKGNGSENKKIEFGGRGTVEVNNSEKQVAANGRYGADDALKVRHGRVLGDGQYIKVYVDDKRVLNVPNADLGRSKKILFNVDARADQAALFGNFRVAAGGKKLYDAIAEKGRVATQGIYFDTGSDRLRPESSPTLKEIAAMLKDHPELKLAIEGHTDNAGAAAANLTLSQQRAAAVKAALVSSYGVADDRLVAKGLGQTKPATPNTTPEGRQQNRRVELVKI